MSHVCPLEGSPLLTLTLTLTPPPSAAHARTIVSAICRLKVHAEELSNATGHAVPLMTIPGNGDVFCYRPASKHSAWQRHGSAMAVHGSAWQCMAVLYSPHIAHRTPHTTQQFCLRIFSADVRAHHPTNDHPPHPPPPTAHTTRPPGIPAWAACACKHCGWRTLIVLEARGCWRGCTSRGVQWVAVDVECLQWV